MKLKKGDTVVVITGKDKGKQGEVQRVLINLLNEKVSAKLGRDLSTTGKMPPAVLQRKASSAV